MEYIITLLIWWTMLMLSGDHLVVAKENREILPDVPCPDEIDGMVAPVNDGTKTDLEILGLFPLRMSGDMVNVGYSTYLSACLAVQHVNQDKSILRDYHLKLVPKDTMNDEGFAVNIVFDDLYSNTTNKKMMVIGGLRNEITEAVSKPLVFWGVVQITYGSHAPSLSSGNPLLFRTIPSTNSYNDPRIKMCMKWEWKNVGILGVNSLDNIAVVNDLITKLDESNIHVMVKEAFNVDKDMETMSQNIAQSLKYLKDKDVRVIIGNFYQKEAIQVFCEAYKAKLYGLNYVWLIWGHYEHEWWKMDDETTDCTMEEISAAVEGYIAVTFDVLGDSNNETISKMVISPQHVRNASILFSGMHGHSRLCIRNEL
nr:gamma-aminobutyric acid type B receptor subunit 1-like [Lytechinus pictus]